MREVGACLGKKEILKTVIENNGGIAKTSDFAVNGINKYEVAAFCKEGVIERIRRGFYQLPQSKSITEEHLIRELLPQGIICVESALFQYGYSDFSPREWSIAVPRTASRVVKNIEEFPMKAYYIQKKFLDIGKSTSLLLTRGSQHTWTFPNAAKIPLGKRVASRVDNFFHFLQLCF